jgi:hypothetical protein
VELEPNPKVEFLKNHKFLEKKKTHAPNASGKK